MKQIWRAQGTIFKFCINNFNSNLCTPRAESRSVQMANRNRARILHQPKRVIPCLGFPRGDGNP
jgi:hypothetical protein